MFDIVFQLSPSSRLAVSLCKYVDKIGLQLKGGFSFLCWMHLVLKNFKLVN